MNILIAEDEESMRCLLREALGTDPTFEITAVANGVEAWWHLTDSTRRFDIAIFDIKMPLADGFSLLRRVRADTRYRSLPVIMCSGINGRESIVQSCELGASYYLMKPFKIETLLMKVEELGQSRRAPLVAARSPLGLTV
jgi:two-component system chemotaxis response regulator CheY